MPQNIIQSPLADRMYQLFLNYSMSVITDRALPDVRDGFKPVQRRILYSMYKNGYTPEKPYKKCAETVGNVLGLLHPHGDASVYDAMVLMAQDFSTRYPIVDGHGNFGSLDGDPAAAYRYTEARLTPYAVELAHDLNKDTVDFVPNYNGESVEPSVMPLMIPNLLANGSSGIAVGMATNIPPHNLNDLYDALIYIIDATINGEEINEDRLISLVKAPDFPTGGVIVGKSGIKEAYKTGKGRIVVRSKYEIEETKNGYCIVITEIPYKINKSNLVKQINDLRKNGSVSEIREVRDESDKNGVRIVVELKHDANCKLVVNKLLKHTDMQTSFSMNAVALVNGVPCQLTLYEMLNYFLIHVADVVIRKNLYELDKSTARLNILEGILALSDEDVLRQVIEMIKTSDEPVEDIMTLGFNKEQAEYIVDMKLRNLSKLSHEKYLAEKEQLVSTIEACSEIINDQKVLLSSIKADFLGLKDRFGDKRKTAIVNEDNSLSEIDLIKEEMLVVTISKNKIIKAMEESEYKTQNRGRKGIKSANKTDDVIEHFFTVNSKDDILFFTNFGRCHILKAYKIEKSNRIARGKSIVNYLNLADNEEVISILATDASNKEDDLLLVTKNGVIKRLNLNMLSSRMSVTKVISFKDNDLLQSAIIVKPKDHVLISTMLGQSIRLAMDATGPKQIRPMGRTAMGVTGIKLSKNDSVVSIALVNDNSTVLSITENGLGKRTKSNSWMAQGRGGKGIIMHKLNKKTGNIATTLTVNDNDEIFVITEKGLISRINVNSISITGRNSSGVKIMSLSEHDKIVSVAKGISEEDIEETHSQISQESSSAG